MLSPRVAPVLFGVLASDALLGVYFTVLILVSGWQFALSQFATFWYFIVSLAIGFGIQIGLYTHLKQLIKDGRGQGKILGVTGTTSTAAMISCCAHYLANLLPIIGAIGIVTFVAQYQIELFWVGSIFNLGGILYMATAITKFKQQKGMNYRYLLAVAGIIVLLYAGFVAYRTYSKEETGTATQTAIQQWETKTDEQAGVTIEVMPVELGKDAQAWRFQIVLTTHTGSLDQDLTQIATLVDDKGNVSKPIGWEGAPPGGHHREGILAFSAIQPSPASIELVINDADGVGKRSFRWNLK